MSDLIDRQAAIDAVHAEFDDCLVWDESGQHTADEVERILTELPSAQRWIPVTKEEMFKAGYEGREIRFRVDGRLFAIRELAQ